MTKLLRIMSRLRHRPEAEMPPTEAGYRRHLADNFEGSDTHVHKRDWAHRIAPLMGACPYMPKTSETPPNETGAR